MAKPTTRGELIDYCLRQLGAPILEINVAEEQTDDLLDDALQYFQERHFDGVEKMYLKYQITQSDIDRARSNTETNRTVGITTYTFQEGNNYIEIPDSVIGIEKIFKFDSNTISGNMFSIKYQLFLNDMYQFNSVDLLNYVMTKSYLEDIDHILTPDVQIRFNKKNRDVGKLAIAKTESIERITNGASALAMRCVEIASGSPLTEEELNGTPNRECPSFWPSP